MKASLTIEASFIYPMIITITFLIILYGFYAHDRLVIKSQCYRTLISNMDSGGSAPDMSLLQDNIEDTCILSLPYSLSYDSDSETISVSDGCGSSMSISFTNHSRCEAIQRYHALMDIVSSQNDKEN